MATKRTSLQMMTSPQQEIIIAEALKRLDNISRTEFLFKAVDYYLYEQIGLNLPRPEPVGGNRWTPFARGLLWARRAIQAGAAPSSLDGSLEAEAIKMYPDSKEDRQEFVYGACQAQDEAERDVLVARWERRRQAETTT